MSQARKDVIWTDLRHPIGQLCAWNYDVGETTLFGDDTLKKVELRDQAQQMAGFWRGSYHGYGRRGASGRGYGRPAQVVTDQPMA